MQDRITVERTQNGWGVFHGAHLVDDGFRHRHAAESEAQTWRRVVARRNAGGCWPEDIEDDDVAAVNA